MSGIGNIAGFSAFSGQGSSDPDKASNKDHRNSVSSSPSSVGSSSSWSTMSASSDSLKERLQGISAKALSAKETVVKEMHRVRKGLSRMGGATAKLGKRVLLGAKKDTSSGVKSGPKQPSPSIVFPQGMEEKYKAIAQRQARSYDPKKRPLLPSDGPKPVKAFLQRTTGHPHGPVTATPVAKAQSAISVNAPSSRRKPVPLPRKKFTNK